MAIERERKLKKKGKTLVHSSEAVKRAGCCTELINVMIKKEDKCESVNVLHNKHRGERNKMTRT